MIVIKQGDITGEDVDAVVNAANAGLRGGGGVDGAIHRAAGPLVMGECRALGGCPTGRAVMTSGGNLKARKIIHAVGPVWTGGRRGEPELLRSAYEYCFNLAKEAGLKSLAFPAISTGVYGYPKPQAAVIALETGIRYENHFLEIRFVCFSDEDFRIYHEAYRAIQNRL